MRSIWKGAVSFGLVSIPVKLYSATEERDVAFHQVHRSDGGRIRYRRVCQLDGEEIQYADIAKGYELPTGEMVVLDDEDFADLPLATSRTIDVLTFVPLEQVDPVYFARSYYLEPEASGTKPYVLLRDALAESGRVALVKVALRQRESLATLRVRDGVFVLETMLWPDEIRRPEFGFLDEEVAVRQQELAMAGSLIESLSGDFAPEEFSDDYRAALQALIDAKVAGREVVSPPEPVGETGAVVDLMEALRASVEAAKSGRGDGRGSGGGDGGGDAGGDALGDGSSGRAASGATGSGSGRSRSGRAGTGSVRAGSGSVRAGTGSVRAGSGSVRAGSGSVRAGSGSVRAGSEGAGSKRAGNGKKQADEPSQRTVKRPAARTSRRSA